jgi:hypothetical protein
MDLLNSAINTGLKGYVAAWSWAPPIVGLTVLSVVMGAAMLWVFAKASDLQKLQSVKRKAHASLLEIRVTLISLVQFHAVLNRSSVPISVTSA